MEWIEIAKDLNAGTIGGVAGIVAGHPLDTIKVKLQTQCHTSSHGILSSVRTIAASEGFRGFYKGMLSPILSNAPINAVVFAIYGQVSRVFLQDKKELTPGEQFIAGAAAGLFQVSFAAPAELVKITMQVNKYPASYSSISCMKDIIKSQGVKGLYRGWQLNMLRDVPAFGSYFYSYEVIKHWLTNGEQDKETTMNLLLAGGSAGSISWMVTQPIDVVKTLVQSQPASSKLSSLDVVKHHYKLEGAGFLFRGFGATILRAFPVSAVTFLVYERSMQYMNVDFDYLTNVETQ
ncbi:mitochondrial carnitine/acylcarnitine carrier protein [Achlya hypogyna]|uniref:Mitochondrial carnitine/acylcarnitine carrier protein n=1 Tax=Achlya hypogyna TaxID=1202772 RepID=A0A1V9Z7U6_ACHHY|nr:mitochondrial carnitine/acylcarnitine carrier protein [Achlya hypogyna]